MLTEGMGSRPACPLPDMPTQLPTSQWPATYGCFITINLVVGNKVIRGWFLLQAPGKSPFLPFPVSRGTCIPWPMAPHPANLCFLLLS